MTEHPNLRVGDAERDELAAQLREHWSLGRLDAEELEERLASTYQARTRRELDALVDDLPELPLVSERKRRRILLPGIAAFHEERRLHASLRVAYDAAWREMVPRLEMHGYFVEEERSPLRIFFLSNAGNSLTVTFRSTRDGGTMVTAFGHAPMAIRRAFAKLRD
jgi:hypothetical protein